MKFIVIFILVMGGIWYGYTYYGDRVVDLKPKDASFPAAGACDFQEEKTVTATINEDIPSPRCIKVRPGQNLRVENNTEKEIRVWFDNVSAALLFPSSIELKPYSKYIFAKPFGEYLEPGVHRLKASVYTGGNGTEIWLIP